MWCLINLIPLRHPKNNIGWITVNYENLVLNPKKELERIFHRWEIPITQEIYKSINKPSYSVDDDPPLKSMQQLKKWENYLTRPEKKN